MDVVDGNINKATSHYSIFKVCSLNNIDKIDMIARVYKIEFQSTNLTIIKSNQ